MSAQGRARFPVVATVVVVIAIGIMLRLGFWQLDRMHQKEAMIARAALAAQTPALLAEPHFGALDEASLYRRAQLVCPKVAQITTVSGRNAAGTPGFAHLARCQNVGFTHNGTAAQGQVDVVLGWSKNPAAARWTGGAVTGIYAPGGPFKYHIVADPPLAGLQANARPDPRSLPNNHFSYAMQWFLFAATALVIYGIALAKRLAVRD